MQEVDACKGHYIWLPYIYVAIIHSVAIAGLKSLFMQMFRVYRWLSVLIITASHQTFSGQFWCLSGQNKFDLTHLLYIINGKVSVFLEEKLMSGQISTLIISTGL